MGLIKLLRSDRIYLDANILDLCPRRLSRLQRSQSLTYSQLLTKVHLH